MCAIDIYVERGKFLNFGSSYLFQEEYYNWENVTSDLQLYAVQPSLGTMSCFVLFFCVYENLSQNNGIP